MTHLTRPLDPTPATAALSQAEADAGAGMPLSHSRRHCRYRVVAVAGDDALTQRLLAFGVWQGAVIERLGQAPFGDPLLFRLHGFRLALRTSEAARVTVVEAA